MSSLTGIAQFTNQFAKNIMGYEDDKKKEVERVADKQYDRRRQQQQDVRTQQNHDVTLAGNQITLSQNKVKNKEFNDATTFENTRNKLAYLKGIGADEQQQVDVLAKAVNSNEKLPYTVEFERGQDGKIIQRQDENGKPFYFQTIIDKETGQDLGRKMTTFEEATGNYTKLQNAGALEDEVKAAQAARAAALQKNQDELSLYGGKAKVDQSKHAANKGVDHGYDVSLEGLKFNNQVKRDENLQGYALDKQNNQAGHAQALAALNGELAAGRIDQAAYNRQAEYLYKAGVDQGQVPNTGGGGSWGTFAALIKPESGGQQLNSRGQPLTSPKGAIGIAQVMPDTAKYVANKNGIKWDANRYKTDANYNYKLGELYYNEQLSKYKHPALAYAAYNAGPGAVDKWLKKNPSMRNPDAMGMQNFINAIPFTETKNYVAKIYRQSSGVQTTLNQPLKPKPQKGSTSKTDNTTKPATVEGYNANITKGLDKALKDVKSLGIKPDAATTATYARAGTKLKIMGTAKNKEEFLNLYQEAFDLVLQAVPERSRKKMSKADQNALGHKVLASMMGVSSLGEVKSTVYGINPAVRDSGSSVSAGGLTLNLPGQQPKQSSPKGTQFQNVQARKYRDAQDAFDGINQPKQKPKPSGDNFNSQLTF